MRFYRHGDLTPGLWHGRNLPQQQKHLQSIGEHFNAHSSNGDIIIVLLALKTYVPRPVMDKRKSWAKQMRNTYNIDDWKKVRFSDEVHFERGAQRKLHTLFANQVNVHVKTVSKNRMSQRRKIKEQKRYYCWAGRGIQLQVGADFLWGPWEFNWKDQSTCLHWLYLGSSGKAMVGSWWGFCFGGRHCTALEGWTWVEILF